MQCPQEKQRGLLLKWLWSAYSTIVRLSHLSMLHVELHSEQCLYRNGQPGNLAVNIIPARTQTQWSRSVLKS